MATERQIEANRRNAQQSTGPRSASGKKRSSKNSYKHGLSKKPSSPARDVETLARQLAGPVNNPKILGLARAAAEADIRLAEIGDLKVEIIESAKIADSDTAAQADNDFRVSEAICHKLPNLVHLLRYEKREAGRRDLAIRKLIRMSNTVI
jgi:hypothetical protein